MKLTFLGATHEVTGSCTLLEACGKKILIDCGMEQGVDTFVNEELPIPPSQIDMVLLTHAHMDHAGKLPLLYKQGFAGQVFATIATEKLSQVMLRDSAHIQMSEAQWKNRKAMRAGKDLVEPLYDIDDAEGVLKCFVCCDYMEQIRIAEGLVIRFVDAGHLLGSSSIEIWITEEENGEKVEKKIVFSGDIGNANQPLICDPQAIEDADYVVMESTYGNRSHGPRTDYVHDLAKILQETFDRGGNVVIPAFAVGRTQEMLYFIRKIKEDHLVSGHDGFEVYVDSPLAVEATRIFMEDMGDFDAEAKALVNQGINPIGFAGLKTAVTSADSVNINLDAKPKVILSASGMCDAGRIRHHLKHNLWRRECTILFVGYQSNGTLGRALVEGTKKVKLFGEEVEVKAKILVLPGISGHADEEGLFRWIAAFKQKPTRVFVNHGDDDACMAFSQRIREELGLNAVAPYSGTIFDLAENAFIKETAGIRIEKKSYTAGVRRNSVFERLLAAGERLLRIIRGSEGLANKDMGRFADQVEELCDKWERR